MGNIILIAGVALLAFSKTDKSIFGSVGEGIKNNLVLKIDQILLRSIRAERTTVAFVIKLRLDNRNFIGGELNRVFGFINYQGFDLGTFELLEPIRIPANEETSLEFEIYVDVSDRGIPAVIRNLWRTGVFSGDVTLIGGVDTSYGVFEFREIRPIL